MSYDYGKLFEKIIEVIGAEVSMTQRMLAVIEGCTRKKPHPDWKLRMIASNLSSVEGTTSGFESGDFLFLGAVEDGHFYTPINAG